MKKHRFGRFYVSAAKRLSGRVMRTPSSSSHYPYRSAPTLPDEPFIESGTNVLVYILPQKNKFVKGVNRKK
jgi:hypothetical protein